MEIHGEIDRSSRHHARGHRGRAGQQTTARTSLYKTNFTGTGRASGSEKLRFCGFLQKFGAPGFRRKLIRIKSVHPFLSWLSWTETLDITTFIKSGCAVISHGADTPHPPFRPLLGALHPPPAHKSALRARAATHCLAPGKPGWVGAQHPGSHCSPAPRFTPPAPRSTPSRSTPDQRGQVVRRPSPAGYCLPPTAELSKTKRDPVSTSGPSLSVCHRNSVCYRTRQFLRTNPSVSPRSPPPDRRPFARGRRRLTPGAPDVPAGCPSAGVPVLTLSPKKIQCMVGLVESSVYDEAGVDF